MNELEKVIAQQAEELQIYRSQNCKFIYVCLQYVIPFEFYKIFPNAFPITEDEMIQILENEGKGVAIIEITSDGKRPSIDGKFIC